MVSAAGFEPATHALKESPTYSPTITCTSSLLHARHNKINEMRIRHRSGCPESGFSNNVTLVCRVLSNAKESFLRTIQYPAFAGLECTLRSR
jgi:hypothetical protein